MSSKDMQEFVEHGMGHWFIRHVGEKKTVRTLSVSKSQPCLIGLFGVRLTFKVVPQKFAPWKKPWPENVMEKESRYVTIDTAFHVLDVMSAPPPHGLPVYGPKLHGTADDHAGRKAVLRVDLKIQRPSPRQRARRCGHVLS